MQRVPLFAGEKLELGDIITKKFPLNIEMKYEVVAANPDHAFIVCVEHGEPNLDLKIQIPRKWEALLDDEAYRMQFSTVMH